MNADGLVERKVSLSVTYREAPGASGADGLPLGSKLSPAEATAMLKSASRENRADDVSAGAPSPPPTQPPQPTLPTWLSLFITVAACAAWMALAAYVGSLAR